MSFQQSTKDVDIPGSQPRQMFPSAPDVFRQVIGPNPSGRRSSLQTREASPQPLPHLHLRSSQSQQRNEFPFPITPPMQPRPFSEARFIQNKHLRLKIPENPQSSDSYFRAYDLSIEKQSRAYTLPTPPRSHPYIPTKFSESPPSSSWGEAKLSPCTFSTATTSANTSPWPSFSTSASPSASVSTPEAHTPTTPQSPARLFKSAADCLRTVLMADDLGMTVLEVQQLVEFADGRHSKRSGRVLVKKQVRKRKSTENLLHKRRRSSRVHTKPSSVGKITRLTGSRRSRNSIEDQPNGGGLGERMPEPKWREIDWSHFSDTSSSNHSSRNNSIDSALGQEIEVDDFQDDNHDDFQRGRSRTNEQGSMLRSNSSSSADSMLRRMDLTRSMPIEICKKPDTRITGF